jgi:hypothetical protein
VDGPEGGGDVAIRRKAITISINGAEHLALDARSRAASLTVPAYVRTQCGLDAWISRGREMEGRAQPASRPVAMALDRMAVTIMVTDAELAELDAGATAAGTSIPQYVRTRCGFKVRNTSLPNTDERGDEEDDAWEVLKGLGLNPEEYFPADDPGSHAAMR